LFSGRPLTKGATSYAGGPLATELVDICEFRAGRHDASGPAISVGRSSSWTVSEELSEEGHLGVTGCIVEASSLSTRSDGMTPKLSPAEGYCHIVTIFSKLGRRLDSLCHACSIIAHIWSVRPTLSSSSCSGRSGRLSSRMMSW